MPGPGKVPSHTWVRSTVETQNKVEETKGKTSGSSTKTFSLPSKEFLKIKLSNFRSKAKKRLNKTAGTMSLGFRAIKGKTILESQKMQGRIVALWGSLGEKLKKSEEKQVGIRASETSEKTSSASSRRSDKLKKATDKRSTFSGEKPAAKPENSTLAEIKIPVTDLNDAYDFCEKLKKDEFNGLANLFEKGLKSGNDEEKDVIVKVTKFLQKDSQKGDDGALEGGNNSVVYDSSKGIWQPLKAKQSIYDDIKKVCEHRKNKIGSLLQSGFAETVKKCIENKKIDYLNDFLDISKLVSEIDFKIFKKTENKKLIETSKIMSFILEKSVEELVKEKKSNSLIEFRNLSVLLGKFVSENEENKKNKLIEENEKLDLIINKTPYLIRSCKDIWDEKIKKIEKDSTAKSSLVDNIKNKYSKKIEYQYHESIREFLQGKRASPKKVFFDPSAYIDSKIGEIYLKGMVSSIKKSIKTTFENKKRGAKIVFLKSNIKKIDNEIKEPIKKNFSNTEQREIFLKIKKNQKKLKGLQLVDLKLEKLMNIFNNELKKTYKDAWNQSYNEQKLKKMEGVDFNFRKNVNQEININNEFKKRKEYRSACEKELKLKYGLIKEESPIKESKEIILNDLKEIIKETVFNKVVERLKQKNNE